MVAQVIEEDAESGNRRFNFTRHVKLLINGKPLTTPLEIDGLTSLFQTITVDFDVEKGMWKATQYGHTNAAYGHTLNGAVLLWLAELLGMDSTQPGLPLKPQAPEEE